MWQEIVALLEETVDERQGDEAFTKSQDALAKLADEAIADRKAGRTEVLDPDTL